MRQELLNRAGEVVGTEQTTEREQREQRLTEQELLRVYQGRVKADNGEALTEYAPSVATHVCECNKGLTRRNYSRKPCEKCGTMPVRATEQREKYAERGNKDRVTCPALFCHGEREQDGFSRKLALRYISSRVIFGKGSKGKGKAPETVKTQNAEKVSSARHGFNFSVACYVEDIAQEAFILWATERKPATDENTVKYAERLQCTLEQAKRYQDTVNACRKALTSFLRAKQKQNIDSVDYQARQDWIAYRSKENASKQDLPCLAQELVNAAQEATEQRGKTGKLKIQAMLCDKLDVSERTLRNRVNAARKQLASV